MEYNANEFLFSLDNSEWMRNGDYAPNRLDSQYDAGTVRLMSNIFFYLHLILLSVASIICNDRTTTNPENTVGIISMAGKGYA